MGLALVFAGGVVGWLADTVVGSWVGWAFALVAVAALGFVGGVLTADLDERFEERRSVDRHPAGGRR